MRHHVGVTTGAVIGNSVEVVGTDGTAALSRLLPRYLSISGIIQGIAILTNWSSNSSFNNGITVTSLVTP